MSDFTQNEIEYLRSGLLGRLATVGPDGTPHIAPVGMIFYNAQLDTIDVGGHDLANTKKFRDAAGTERAALVVGPELGSLFRLQSNRTSRNDMMNDHFGILDYYPIRHQLQYLLPDLE